MTQIARLYGGSLYDLAAEEQMTDTVLAQMDEIRQLFREMPEYQQLLSQPAIPKGERTEMIEQAFGDRAERYVVNFLKILCERNILQEFAGCCDAFTQRYNAEHNIAEAVVVSAVALNEKQMAALTAKLEKISGKKVSLVQKRDASVIGGLRVELEGKQLDGTISGRMSGISRTINELVV